MKKTVAQILGNADSVCGMYLQKHADGTMTDFWTIKRWYDGSLHGRTEITSLIIDNGVPRLQHTSTWHDLSPDTVLTVVEGSPVATVIAVLGKEASA